MLGTVDFFLKKKDIQRYSGLLYPRCKYLFILHGVVRTLISLLAGRQNVSVSVACSLDISTFKLNMSTERT